MNKRSDKESLPFGECFFLQNEQTAHKYCNNQEYFKQPKAGVEYESLGSCWRWRILYGRFLRPFFEFGFITRDTEACGIHLGQLTFRVCVALLGGFSKPFCRFGIVARYAATGVIHYAETVLGHG